VNVYWLIKILLIPLLWLLIFPASYSNLDSRMPTYIAARFQDCSWGANTYAD